MRFECSRARSWTRSRAGGALDIHETPVNDLRPLTNLVNLRELIIMGTAVSDLSALTSLSNLEKLDIRLTPVSNLSLLTHLSSLKQLIMSRDSNLDLKSFHGKTELKIRRVS